MKEWHKDLSVGFIVVVVCLGIIILFCVKPVLIFWLCIGAVIYGFLYMCYKIGEGVRKNHWYDDIVFSLKKLIDKTERGGKV